MIQSIRNSILLLTALLLAPRAALHAADTGSPARAREEHLAELITTFERTGITDLALFTI